MCAAGPKLALTRAACSAPNAFAQRILLSLSLGSLLSLLYSTTTTTAKASNRTLILLAVYSVGRLPITRKTPNFFLHDVLIRKCPTPFQCLLCFQTYLPGLPLNPENNCVICLILFGPPTIFTCAPSLSASVSLSLGSSVGRKGALSQSVFRKLYGPSQESCTPLGVPTQYY